MTQPICPVCSTPLRELEGRVAESLWVCPAAIEERRQPKPWRHAVATVYRRVRVERVTIQAGSGAGKRQARQLGLGLAG